MVPKNRPAPLLGAVPAAVLLALATSTVHADKITDDIAGWNMGNVTVQLYDLNGDPTTVTYDEATGAYPAEYQSFLSLVDNGAGATTGIVKGKNYPVGKPPGIKIVNSSNNLPFANGKPSNCIMTTSYLEEGYLDTANPIETTCGSGFQTHKRFKVNMQPAALTDGVELVFNVEPTAAAETRHYQVFQKINNYTGTRLQGFKIEIGTGTGAAFVAADPAQLALAIPANLWADEDLATFSHGLFGPVDSHFPDPGFFDNVRAGFNVQLVDGLGSTYASAVDTDADYRGATDATTGAPLVNGIRIESTAVMASNYSQVPPAGGTWAAGPADQFGEWIHSGQVPYGIFFDDDNDPTTDAVLQAFWGATDTAGTTFGWMRGEADSWAVVDPSVVTGWWADPAYSVGPIEDLLNLAPNYMVTVDDSYADTTFTIRITPIAAAANTDPAYVANPPTFTGSDGFVVIGPDPVMEGGTLGLRVNDGDILAGNTQNVTVTNQTTGETETVALIGELDGVVQGTLATSTDVADNGNDSGALFVAVGDVIEVSYTDANDGAGGVDVLNTDTTTVAAPVVDPVVDPVTPPATSTTSSGGGCTISSGSNSDWSLPLLLASLLGYGWMRRRRNKEESLQA